MKCNYFAALTIIMWSSMTLTCWGYLFKPEDIQNYHQSLSANEISELNRVAEERAAIEPSWMRHDREAAAASAKRNANHKSKRFFQDNILPPKLNVSFNGTQYPATSSGIYYSSDILSFFPNGLPAFFVNDPANNRAGYSLSVAVQVMLGNVSYLDIPSRNSCFISEFSVHDEFNFFSIMKQTASLGDDTGNRWQKYFGLVREAFLCDGTLEAHDIWVTREHNYDMKPHHYYAMSRLEFADTTFVSSGPGIPRIAVVDMRSTSLEINDSIFQLSSRCLNNPLPRSLLC